MLYIENLETGTRKPAYEVSSSEEDILEYHPSPDNKKLAITTSSLGYVSESLEIIDIESGEQLFHSEQDRYRGFSWSPAGNVIGGQLMLDTSNDHHDFPLFVAGIDSGEIRQIDLGRCLEGLTWSPDGTQLVFENADDGMVIENGKFDYDIFTIDVETFDVRNITNSPSSDYQPAWSPDGQYIAYTSYGYTGKETQEICLVHVDGTDLGCITDTPNQEASLPQWSPSGEWIAFAVYDGSENYLAMIRPDGSERTRLFTWPDN